MALTIFQNEKTLFRGINTTSSKSRKIDIFSKEVNPCFWSKNGHFSKFLFRHYWAENVFYDFPERKNAFLGYKNKKFQKSKMALFPKGLTNGFGPKMAIFPSVFLQTIQARKMSSMIFQNVKSPFQAIKTRRSKSRKMAIFSKGLNHRFGPKMTIFPKFLFRQYNPGKRLLGYSRRKKRLPRL